MTAVDKGPIRLRLLGDFEIRRGDLVLRNAEWHRRKAAHLLQRLALERRLLKEQAIEFLWPGWDPTLGANNLYRTLYALRRTLDEALGDGTSDATLAFQAGVLTLDASVQVDVDEFERLVAQAADAAPDEGRALLQEALARYSGDLLPDELYAEWSLTWRTRLRRRYRRVSLELAALMRDRGEHERALELLTPLLDKEPTDEPVHRELMRLYALAGRRDAALRQYETCVAALATELNVPPNEQTTALHDKIRNGELDPPPALEPADIPAAPAPLFGREQEVRLIADCLDNPLCRLLTLTGPGGVGKTRLAQQVVREKHAKFAHGAVVVSLASLSSPDLLVAAIADALKLTFPAGRPAKTHLLAHLREKRLLLVLDNFEHLSEAAPLLVDVLAQAPGVKLLVTSREQVRLHEEWVIEVGELSCPEDPDAPDVEDYSAIRLFLHSARHLQPGFALSDENRHAVVRICRLTGGLPLALELAAGWVRTLPVTTLADEIAQNPDVLATPLRDVPARHRSLRAVFEDSWQHLTATEQTAFSRLSAFRGSFSREAAEQVATATLSTLSALVAKSRLKRTDEGRYELHPLLRQFGREKLAAGGESEKVLDRHCRAYIDFLEAMTARLRGGHDREALDQIEAEIDDVRAAWQRAMERRDIAAVGRGVEGLALFYQIRGRYDEALDALGAALDMVEAEAPDEPAQRELLVRGKLLSRQGSIYFCLHRYDQAEAQLEESLAIFRGAGARSEMAYALKVLGDCATLQGRPGEAHGLYEECLTIHTQSGDPSGIAWARNRLGWALTQLGEYEEAEEHLLRSLAQFRELDHQRGMVGALSDLGILAHRRGTYRQAERHYEQAIALSRAIGYEDGAARSLCELGDVCRDLGELRRARDYVSEALVIFSDVGSLDQFLALYRLGHLSILLDEATAAETYLQESLALAKEADSAEGVGHTLLGLGELALTRGQPREAQHRFRESLTRFEEIGEAGDPWGRVEAHYGLSRAARALDAAQSARRHLSTALTIAQELPSVPHILDLLTQIAALVTNKGADAQALELIAFTLDHPACRKSTREQAHSLFAHWTAPLSPGEVAALRERSVGQTLDSIVDAAQSRLALPSQA